MNVFLFGAGASYGSLACYPDVPPLGLYLFDELRELGGFVSGLSSQRKARFKPRFEVGMAELYMESSKDAFALLREMSIYFAQFRIASPENLYFQLISEILASDHPFALATTNYDLLIEQAINLNLRQVSLTPTSNQGMVPLYKLHGSCNYLPKISGINFNDCQFITGTGGIALDTTIRVVSPAEAIQFCREQNSVAPVIAMYTTGKEIKFCARQVLEQQKTWQQLTLIAKANFVIGLAITEEDCHIWDYLADSPARLFYVGKQSDIESWAERRKKANVTWLSEKFVDAMPQILENI